MIENAPNLIFRMVSVTHGDYDETYLLVVNQSNTNYMYAF